MSVGYSGKPVFEKLGIKPGGVIHAVSPPADYASLLGRLPEGARIRAHRSVAELADESLSFVHIFATSRAELQAAALGLARSVAPGGILWVSWPKRSAARTVGMPSDLTEDTLRELLLPTGLVDVKVCAVSDLWSGLKFVWRKQ